MSIWVVIEQGTEYNDSTYDIAGEATVGKNAYASRQDAEKAMDERLRERLSGFRLRDFDEGYGRFSSPGYDEAIDGYFTTNDVGTRQYGGYDRTYWDGGWDLRWEDFIDYCDERGYRWKHLAPELLTVQEVRVNITHE